jgi:hypothetical protein
MRIPNVSPNQEIIEEVVEVGRGSGGGGGGGRGDGGGGVYVGRGQKHTFNGPLTPVNEGSNCI